MACGDDQGSDTGTVGSSGGGGQQANTGSGTSSAGMSSGWGTAGRGLLGGQMCPMTEVEATGACTPARGSCMFGERTCDCSSETMMWACWSPMDCPTTVPTEQSACDVVGMNCSPARGESCTCTAAGWDCGNQVCPSDEPAVGSACERGPGVCMYGARTCDCEDEVWTCWSPATDCPAEPPADRAVCWIDGAICAYEGGDCECSAMSGWRCGRGVMNDPDEDAGVPPGPAAGAGGSVAGAGGGGVSGSPEAGSGGVAAAGAGGTLSAGASGGDGNAGSAGAP